MPGPLNLTNEKISFTFERLIQTDGAGNFFNGLGDPVIITGAGTSGTSGTSGSGSGQSGTSGTSGQSGTSGTSGGGEYYIQSPPPPTATTLGARWYDLTTGSEYVWIDDGNTSQWVTPANGQGPSGTSGTSGSIGATGPSGTSGTSGSIGATGPSGTSGTSGINGFSTGLVYYFNASVPSSVSGYYDMSRNLALGGGVTRTASGLGDQLIEEFVTGLSDPGVTNIPSGVWNFEQYASMNSAGGTPSIFANIYVRALDGTETLIGSNTTLPRVITEGTTVQLYLFSMPIIATTILSTDRIVVKFYGRNLAGRTLTLYFEDTTVAQVTTSLSAAISGTSGTSGTSGSIGATGPTGPTGATGPAGGGGSSFIYDNTAFVHPDGNDGTAVIGDFSLPFGTISGALTALSGASAPDPVIEIWPKNSARGPAPTYLPSGEYDYQLNDGLIISSDIKIHLKSGARIKYTNNTTSTDTPLFDFTNDWLLTVTAEDSSSTLEVISKNGYEYFIKLVAGSQAIFENVTIYSESKQTDSPFLKLDSTGFAAFIGVGSKMIIRNCLFYNNPPSTNYAGNVYMLEEGVFESWNSRMINIQSSDNTSSHIYQESSGDYHGQYSVVRLHDTAAVQRNTLEISSNASVISINGDVKSYAMIGNCTFWFFNDSTTKIGGGVGARPLLSSSSNASYVQYVSRSINNYNAVAYGGTWMENTGAADSNSDLGRSGYGQFEYYTDVWEPFDTV